MSISGQALSASMTAAGLWSMTFRAVRGPVVSLPMAQGGRREAEAGRKLFLGHVHLGAKGFDIQRTGTMDAGLRRSAFGVLNGLQQAALDVVGCAALGRSGCSHVLVVMVAGH